MLSTRQKRRHNNISTVHIRTPNSSKIGRFTVSPVIIQTAVEKMVGLHISQDLSFVQHLITNKNSVINKLKKRLVALKQLRKVANFKSRLSVANAIFM